MVSSGCHESQISKEEARNLLSDLEFDRKYVVKSEVGDVLLTLLRKRAFSKESAVLVSDLSIHPEKLDVLINAGRVEVVIQSPAKIYLTPMGKIIAAGEYIIRKPSHS